jgi:hypothetical protein
MRAFRELERIEDRVLAALRCVDAATGVPVSRRLEVEALGAPAPRLLRNRSGLLVVAAWPPLAAHSAAFEAPPSVPPAASLVLHLRIEDPRGQYLPRRFALSLPRDPDPAADAGVLHPVEVALFAAPAAPTGTNWAVLRLSLASSAGQALGGALARVRRNGEVLARGLSDWRGEAMVPVVGVPVTTFSEGEDVVVVDEIEVVLEAAFDPDAGTRTPLAQVRDGRPPEPLPLVDPAALDAAFDALPRATVTLSIAARRHTRRTLTLDLP